MRHISQCMLVLCVAQPVTASLTQLTYNYLSTGGCFCRHSLRQGRHGFVPQPAARQLVLQFPMLRVLRHGDRHEEVRRLLNGFYGQKHWHSANVSELDYILFVIGRACCG